MSGKGAQQPPRRTGTDSLTLDFSTVVYRLQLLGFNAVRLPFSFTDLYDTPPKSQTRSCPQARPEPNATPMTDPQHDLPSILTRPTGKLLLMR